MSLRHALRTLSTCGVFALMLLTGCAVTPPQLPLDQKVQPITVPAGHGVVVLRVQVAQTYPAPQTSRWHSLSFDPVEGKGSFSSYSMEGAHAGHSTFYRVLPKGLYRPGLLQASYQVGNMIYSGSLPIGGVGEFQVNEGEIVDLGTVAIMATAKSIDVSSNRRETNTRQALLAYPITSSKEESDQVLNILRPKLPPMKVRRGEEVWTVNVMREMLALPIMRQGISARLLSAVNAGDVNYSGEELGQVRIRRDGEWQWLDTGMSHSVGAVDVLTDGTLLVGGSHGVVLSRKPDAKTWEPHLLPTPDGVLVSLTHNETSGIVAVVNNSNEAIVFSKENLASPWRELHRIPLGGRNINIYAGSSARGISVLITEVGFTSSANVHFMDAKTQLWSINPFSVPWTGVIGAVNITPDGSLFSINGGSAMTQSLRVTEDGGKTWETRESPQWVHALGMIDRNKGYAIRLESMGIVSAARTKFTVWKTLDGGRSWKSVSEAPALFMRIIPIGAKDIVAVTNTGAMYMSEDEGATWREAKLSE